MSVYKLDVVLHREFMKTLVKYLLSLCFLLLSVHPQLSAQAAQENGIHFTLKSLKGLDEANFGIQSSPSKLTFTSSSSESDHNFEAKAEVEEEENEVHSHFFSFERSAFLTAVFCAFLFGAFLHVKKAAQPFYKQFSDATAYKWFVVFQVFRI